jgi:hypothetical protein
VSVRELPDATLVEAAQPTFYTAIAADRRVRVAVNVLDPAVSALNRTAFAGAAPANPVTSTGAARMPAPWLALLMLAALLLVFEWWTYNRRFTI